MSITHCFQPGTVVPDLRSTDKFEALRELISRVPVFRDLKTRVDFPGGFCAAFAETVIQRERQQTTGFGHGVAVAHGRLRGVPRVTIALGISRQGIPYDSPDDEAVRLLFVIASPPELSLDYLQALSTLVRCLREKTDRERLIEGETAVEIEQRMRAAFTAQLERFTEPQPGNAAAARTFPGGASAGTSPGSGRRRTPRG